MKRSSRGQVGGTVNTLAADTETNYQTSHLLIIIESSEPAIISRRILVLVHAVNTGRAILFAVVIHSTDKHLDTPASYGIIARTFRF
jgi:hypothetical protein